MGTNICSEDAHCVNSFAGYNCKCKTGFRPIMNDLEGETDLQCQDIDECESGAHSNSGYLIGQADGLSMDGRTAVRTLFSSVRGPDFWSDPWSGLFRI